MLSMKRLHEAISKFEISGKYIEPKGSGSMKITSTRDLHVEWSYNLQQSPAIKLDLLRLQRTQKFL